MRTKLVTLVFFCALIFSACEKETAIDPAKEAHCENMLYFDSFEELFQQLESINNMNEEEKSSWERSRGFKSLGLASERFYQSIDLSQFNSDEEIRHFIKSNNGYLQLIEDGDGEPVLEPVLGGSPFRYLANIDGLIHVNNSFLKVYDKGVLLVDDCHFEKIKTATLQEAKTFSQEFYSENLYINKSLNSTNKPCGTVEDRGTDGSERIRLKIQAWNTNGPSVFQGIVTYEARPFKRVLGIWYWCTRTISCNLVMDVNYKNNMGIDTIYQFRYSNPGERSSVLSNQDYFHIGYANPQVSLGYYRCVARQLGCPSDSAYVYNCE